MSLCVYVCLRVYACAHSHTCFSMHAFVVGVDGSVVLFDVMCIYACVHVYVRMTMRLCTVGWLFAFVCSCLFTPIHELWVCLFMRVIVCLFVLLCV